MLRTSASRTPRTPPGSRPEICIQTPEPEQEESVGIEKIRQTLQVAWNLGLWSKDDIQNPNSDPDMAYNPKIYIPSGWEPDVESSEINLRVHDFRT